jgi:myo-inositol-1(or 4)-monophosphatase
MDRMIFARDLAREVGQLLRSGFGKAEHIRTKGSHVDLVTEFDLQAEELILDRIRQEYPDATILSEESGKSGDQSDLWIIDPLDGTTNFAHSVPIFSVSIAYLSQGSPELGVVYAPMLEEFFTAIAGHGAWLNDEPLSVSKTQKLDESLLVTGFPYDIRSRPDNNLDHYATFALRSRAVRRLGSAAIDLCYVAAGRFDAYWELETHPWDCAAGGLLVKEAGGKMTRVDGQDVDFTQSTSLVASNGRLHPQILSLLAE